MCLGCGAPLFFLTIKEGDTILIWEAAAGLTVLWQQKRVGKSGRVIGIDLTPEMVEKARLNGAESGFDNVEFIHGSVENLPLADHSIDAVISNCPQSGADKSKGFF